MAPSGLCSAPPASPRLQPIQNTLCWSVRALHTPGHFLQSFACAVQELYTSCGKVDKLGRADPLGKNTTVLASVGTGFGVFGRVGVLLSRP